MTVGLMMVVKNEAKRMISCLDWHIPYVDEVAICDQSSTDDTYRVIEDYLAKLNIPHHLIKDEAWGFCEPSKQKTADLLNSDWILYIDPDEKFPVKFLEKMHQIITSPKYDGYIFPRENYFEVQVFTKDVPIEPKWITVRHPTKDPQLRLTRKSLSVFPEFLHHRVRVNLPDGTRRIVEIPFPIEHKKTLTEQWDDQKRYKIVNETKNDKS